MMNGILSKVFVAERTFMALSLLLLAAMFCLPATAAQAHASEIMKNKSDKQTEPVYKPDFAFPETVMTDADKQLVKALSDHNGVLALRAILDKTLAESMKNPDHVAVNITGLDAYADQLPAEWRPFVYVIEAMLYTRFYQRDAWTYNNRQQPDQPLPADPSEWSRNQFADKVLDLLQKAVTELGNSDSRALSDYPSLFMVEKNSPRFTVTDFVRIKSIELISQFIGYNPSDEIPFMVRDNPKAARNRLEAFRNKLIEQLLNSTAGRSEMTQVMIYLICSDNYVSNSMEKERLIKSYLSELTGTPDCALLLLLNYNGDDVDEDDYDIDEDDKDYLDMLNRETNVRIRTLTDYISAYPDAPYIDRLKGLVNTLCNPQVVLSCPNFILPGKHTSLKIRYRNISDFEIIIVPKYSDRWMQVGKLKKEKNKTASIPVRVTRSAVWREITVDIPALAAGRYYIAAYTDQAPAYYDTIGGRKVTVSFDDNGVTEISVRQMMLVGYVSKITGDKYEYNVYAFDAGNMVPLRGVSISALNPGERKKGYQYAQTTGDSGAVTFVSESRRLEIEARYKGITENISVYYNRSDDKGETLQTRLFTDRAIYKPGDKLGFSAVIWRKKNNILARGFAKADSGVMAEVTLHDVNNNKVDSILVAIDELGRASGYLDIPDSGLTGNWHISSQLCVDTGQNDKLNSSATTYVTVEEYKEPSFHVDLEVLTPSVEVGMPIRIKGVARTWSGMPVSDAEVKYQIETLNCWWYRKNSEGRYSGVARTDKDGVFEVELGTDNLRFTSYAEQGYSIVADVTDSAGETNRSDKAKFNVGRTPMQIELSVPGSVEWPQGADRINARLINNDGNPVAADFSYELSDIDGRLVSRGVTRKLEATLSELKLASGRYSLKVSHDGAQPAARNFIVWKISDKVPPVDTALWVPRREYVGPAGETVRILLGSTDVSQRVLANIYEGDKLVRTLILEPDGAMISIPVTVPAPDSRATIHLITVRNNGVFAEMVTVVPEEQTKNVSILAESFRDRLNPGQPESWKFKLLYDGEPVRHAPIMAVMTNKALNVLAPFSWNFNPYSQLRYPLGRGFINSLSATLLSRQFAGNLYQSYFRINAPELILGSGLSHAEFFAPMIRNMMMRKSMAMGSADMMADEDGGVAVVEFSSAPLAAGVSAESALSADMNNRAVETADSQESYRELECPIAFFMPDLTTDHNGEVEVAFDVPDYNGTWQFQILGYTADMKGDVKILDAVASRKVMTRINAPRYMRTGDRMSVAATIYNNSDNNIPIGGRIEIINPITGYVVAKSDFEPVEVESSGNRVINIDFEVPAETQFLTIRAYGEGDGVRDGEQTSVEVLPASEPVIESVTFYAAPGQKDVEFTLPDTLEKGSLTLQYCDNPIWECVKAMPDLLEPDGEFALNLIYRLYGNAMTRHLCAAYPDILEGLKAMADPANADAGELVSNLSKNEELKNMLLTNTPWMINAGAETLRMGSLVNYADSAKVESAITQLISKLAETQLSDGGWPWCPGMKASAYITSRIVLYLAMLRDSGAMPAPLEKNGSHAVLIEKAVRYLDKVELDFYDKIKNKNEISAASMLNYFYVRSYYDYINLPPQLEKLYKRFMNQGWNWRELGLYDRAVTAIVLNHGSSVNKSEARNILESLTQLAMTDQAKGAWYETLNSRFGAFNKLITTTQILEAFMAVSPRDNMVGKLRQWLILSRQTEEWGDNRYTVEIISALLRSTDNPVVKSVVPEVHVGDRLLSLPASAALTGSFTLPIDYKETKGEKITISRGADGPAWGGVISISQQPVTKVKAAKVPDLSITKEIYKVDAVTGKVTKTSHFEVGDKVRVTLTIKSGRDMEYVSLTDNRPSCLEPVETGSEYIYKELWMYREVRDAANNFFIDFLPKGTSVVSYECYIDRGGTYASGIASIQSLYAPVYSAHSAGDVITVKVP